MSVERSRPSSASLRSTRESLSREPSSRRLSSTDRSQSGAAEISNYGGTGYRHSMSRSASRPASPGRASSQTIPAYNPSFGRSIVTSSNSKLPSTAASRQSLGSTSFRLTQPDASLRRSSTSNTPGASHPYATQASHSWGVPQSSANKQSSPSSGDSGIPDFLSMMEKRKAEAAGSSVHSQPRRSNSNPKAFLELGGQLVSSSMASLGDKLRRWDTPSEIQPLFHTCTTFEARSQMQSQGVIKACFGVGRMLWCLDQIFAQAKQSAGIAASMPCHPVEEVFFSASL